jgi:hypothetical protein
MFWEIYQQSRINQANNRTRRVAADSQKIAHSMRILEDKIDSLSLTCQALWEIVRESTNLTEEALNRKIREVDLRVGRQDGKLGSRGKTCTNCGRVYNVRHLRCMYCGEPKSKDHVFQS